MLQRRRVGQIIAEARKKNGITQTGLASIVDYSRSRIQQIEQGFYWRDGEKVPSQVPQDVLVKIASIVGANVPEVLRTVGADSNTVAKYDHESILDVADLSTRELKLVEALITSIRETRTPNDQPTYWEE